VTADHCGVAIKGNVSGSTVSACTTK